MERQSGEWWWDSFSVTVRALALMQNDMGSYWNTLNRSVLHDLAQVLTGS